MKRRILAAAIIAFACTPLHQLWGQTLQSSYFLEGTTHRHQLNPAFLGERNYISLPVLGNLNVGTTSNISLSNVIYKVDDPTSKYSLTTFMNSTVGREEFLSKINQNNRFNIDANITLLSAGFYAWGGFNTIEINSRSSSSLVLPYGLFDFMKTGMDKDSYHIGATSFDSNNYLELGLGHAMKLSDKITVGAKLKFLLGGMNVNAKIDAMDVELTADKWAIMANGKLNASVGGGEFKTSSDNPGEISGLKFPKYGVGGYGGAVDLGITYRPIEDLQLSAAVTDLGAISWTNNLKGATKNDLFVFEGFNNISVNQGEGGLDNIDKQFERLKDDLMDLTKFYDEGKSKRTTMLTSTVNVGAEYSFPFYKRLSVGLLSSTKINQAYTWSKTMLSANITPLNWVGASVSCAYSPFGTSLGWMVNFHPKGATIFFGSDYQFTRVTPQFIPISNFNTNVSLGFNVTFGKKHTKLN